MNEQSFFAEIEAAPSDSAPKLIFADWLEERGDKRADFIRAVHVDEPNEKLLELAGIEKEEDPLTTVCHTDIKPEYFHLFAADCAEHVLPLFEKYFPDDKRPRKLIEAVRHGTNVKQAKEAAQSSCKLAHRLRDGADAEVWAVEAADYASDVVIHVKPALVRNALRSTAWAVIYATSYAAYPEQCRNKKRWVFVRLCEYKLFERPIYCGDVTNENN